jgi:hypothetical protein
VPPAARLPVQVSSCPRCLPRSRRCHSLCHTLSPSCRAPGTRLAFPANFLSTEHLQPGRKIYPSAFVVIRTLAVSIDVGIACTRELRCPVLGWCDHEERMPQGRIEGWHPPVRQHALWSMGTVPARIRKVPAVPKGEVLLQEMPKYSLARGPPVSFARCGPSQSLYSLFVQLLVFGQRRSERIRGSTKRGLALLSPSPFTTLVCFGSTRGGTRDPQDCRPTTPRRRYRTGR